MSANTDKFKGRRVVASHKRRDSFKTGSFRDGQVNRPGSPNGPRVLKEKGSPKREAAPAVRKPKKRRGSVGNILVGVSGGKKLNKPASPKLLPTIATLKEEMSTQSVNGWQMMSSFGRAISKMSTALSEHGDADDAAAQIIESTCEVLNCDRATLFFVDAEANEIICVVGKGADNIRLPIGKGIAGSVAGTGETVNIPDAYLDNRFDQSFDKVTGYRTKSILCGVVRDPEGDAVAVLQCINKKTGVAFTPADVMILNHLTVHVGIVLNNARMLESERATQEKCNSLLEVVKTLHFGTNSSPHSLIFTLSNQVHRLVDAERCTLYLVDHQRQQLVVMQGDIDIRLPLGKGIAGHVATTGQTLMIADAYEDERFNRAMDEKTGFRTKSILTMPIFAAMGEGKDSMRQNVVGLLQVINKTDDTERFLKSDEILLRTLLNIAGPLLEECANKLLHHGGTSNNATEYNERMPSPSLSPGRSPSRTPNRLSPQSRHRQLHPHDGAPTQSDIIFQRDHELKQHKESPSHQGPGFSFERVSQSLSQLSNMGSFNEEAEEEEEEEMKR